MVLVILNLLEEARLSGGRRLDAGAASTSSTIRRGHHLSSRGFANRRSIDLRKQRREFGWLEYRVLVKSLVPDDPVAGLYKHGPASAAAQQSVPNIILVGETLPVRTVHPEDVRMIAVLHPACGSQWGFADYVHSLVHRVSPSVRPLSTGGRWSRVLASLQFNWRIFLFLAAPLAEIRAY